MEAVYNASLSTPVAHLSSPIFNVGLGPTCGSKLYSSKATALKYNALINSIPNVVILSTFTLGIRPEFQSYVTIIEEQSTAVSISRKI